MRDQRDMTKWEYIVVPLDDASGLKKKSDDLTPDHLNELGAQGWEAVGLSLKKGDLIAWPVVLLKRQVADTTRVEHRPEQPVHHVGVPFAGSAEE